jgi:hypothetical protein
LSARVFQDIRIVNEIKLRTLLREMVSESGRCLHEYESKTLNPMPFLKSGSPSFG